MLGNFTKVADYGFSKLRGVYRGDALIAKIAALYVQGFQDPVLLDAVDDMEDLTAGFSRKIWQKLTILEAFGRTLAANRP